MTSKPFTRRAFLAGGAVAGGALVAGAAWFRELSRREAAGLVAPIVSDEATHLGGGVVTGADPANWLGAPARAGVDYGALAPVAEASTGLPLLQLPSGFSYTSFGWTGDPMITEGESSPESTPHAHDGMGCFAPGPEDPRHQWRLVRNHERQTGRFGRHAPVYDPAAGGGTTTLVFDGEKGGLIEAHASLAGTVRNCAGGAAPWGSWVSCEETQDGPGDGPWQREHGFCFEVPAQGVASAEPLRALGRFKHEAIAFSPDGRTAYLTEDNDPAGLFRFVLRRPGDLRSGELQMLRVQDSAEFDTRRGQQLGEALSVDWVTIDDPSPEGDAAAVAANGPTPQGIAKGAALFRRLEGAVFHDGHLVFASTTGGDAALGQIWDLDAEAAQLRLVYESSDVGALEYPDNLAVSPRGGVVICEDGPGENRLLGLSAGGDVFPIVRGDVRLAGQRGLTGDFSGSEIAGACWSGDGRWLFFNIQKPGITFAVTGPWSVGAV